MCLSDANRATLSESSSGDSLISFFVRQIYRPFAKFDRVKSVLESVFERLSEFLAKFRKLHSEIVLVDGDESSVWNSVERQLRSIPYGTKSKVYLTGPLCNT